MLGRRFERVTLEVATGPNEVPSTLGVQFSDAYNRESLSQYAAGKLDVADLLIAFAGGAAESILAGSRTGVVQEGMTCDFQNIGYAVTTRLKAAGDAEANGEFANAIFAAALERAGAFVRSNRASIESVARQLAAKKSLRFEEVSSLAKEALLAQR